MITKVTRRIHPVGQGAFYTERLLSDNGRSFNIVYDCGSLNKDSLVREVNNYLDSIKSEHIDAIFISHFHDDHINGIKLLLETNKVKHIIIPQISTDIFLESNIYNYKNRKTESIQLINDLRFNTSIKDAKIHKIIETNNTIINNEVDLNDLQNVDIENGIKLTIENDWIFIPYNICNNLIRSKQTISFEEFLCKNLGLMTNDLDSSDFNSILHNYDINKLTEIYTKYFGRNLNHYSMTLYSGPTNNNWEFIFNSLNCYCNSLFNCYYRDGCIKEWTRHHNLPHFLYFGDFNTKSKNNLKLIKQFYDKYWDMIKSLQVPHHGSSNNSSANLFRGIDFAIISFGVNNKYHHPAIQTLLLMYNNNCCPILVSNCPNAEFEFSYYRDI